jgi:hypothetical protein
MDRTIGALGKRVFVMNNVHDDAPIVFETRWTLSYLSGPLTREQIKTLMAARARAGGEAPAADAATPAGGASAGTTAGARRAVAASGPAAGSRPVLPPDVPQFFVPRRQAGSDVIYEPRLFASGQVQFVDAKLGVNELREVAALAPFVDAPLPVDFTRAAVSEVALNELEADPEPGARFADVPPPAAKAKNYDAWGKEFVRWLYQTQALELRHDPATDVTSRPGESERDFRIRLQIAQREQRDAAKEALQKKYAPKLAALNEKKRRAEERVTREADQASAKKVETALSVGASMLGALFGRKTLSATNIGRMTTAAKSASRTMKESKDVALATENVAAIDQQIQDLDARLQSEIAGIEAQPDATTAPLETIAVKPKKTQIAVRKVVLAWVPGGERG